MALKYTSEQIQGDEIAREAQMLWALSTDHLSQEGSTLEQSGGWLSEADECFEFRDGNQWSVQEKAAIEDEERIPVTFNKAAIHIDAVSGLETNNRNEVRYYPREQGDVKTSEIMNGAAAWARDGSDAEDKESDAFRDMITCGVGVVYTGVDFENDPEGMITYKRCNPLRARWDPSAVERNLTDREWCMYAFSYTRAQVKRRWPDLEDSQLAQRGVWDIDLDDLDPSQVLLGDEQWRYSPLYSGSMAEATQTKVNVVLYQKKVGIDLVTVQVPGGGTRRFTKEEYDRIKVEWERSLRQSGVVPDPVPGRGFRVEQHYIVGNTTVKSQEAPAGDRFNLNFITGKRDEKANTWYGIMRGLRDPQKWMNKFFSVIIEIIAANSKGGIMAERDAFEDQDSAEESWARADGISWMNPGALQQGKVQEKPKAAYPAGLERLFEIAGNAFRDTSGISMELLGIADRVQAGVLEAQRKQAGMTVLAWAFDALRLYRKENGRLLVDLIREHIADNRLVQVVGEEGARYVRLTKKDMVLEYDLIVDEAPTSVNAKERTWMALEALIPVMLKAGIPLPPEIVDFSPLPTTLAEKFKAMQKPDPQQQQQKQQLQALTIRELMAKVEKLISETEENRADAQLKQAQAEETRAGADKAAAETGQLMGAA